MPIKALGAEMGSLEGRRGEVVAALDFPVGRLQALGARRPFRPCCSAGGLPPLQSSDKKEGAVLLSSLYEKLGSAPQDVGDYQVYLAAPDAVVGDDIDVFVTGIDSVHVDHDRNKIVLVPRSGTEPSASGMPILMLSILIEQLPPDTARCGDFEILAELPLDRESHDRVVKSTASVSSLHIGEASGEAWFLVRPASEYPGDLLPA